MMPSNGNWASMLGAALSQGGQTFGALSQIEKEDKLRRDQLARQAEQDKQRHEIDTEQLGLQRRGVEGQESERRQRQLMAAIEGLDPGAQVGEDLYSRAQAEGLEGRFNVDEAGEQMPLLAGGGPFGGIGSVPLQERNITRKPTMQESAFLEDRNLKRQEADKKNIFQTHLTSTEHAGETHDQRVNEGLAHGVSVPLSSGEFDRREEEQTKNAIRVALAKSRGAGTSNLEGLADAVIANPHLYQTLTPSARTKLAPTLSARGFDFETSMAESAKKYAAEGASALDTAGQLQEKLATPEGQAGMGPLKGYAGMLPDTDLMQNLFGTRDVKFTKANLNLVKQRIGKLLEGGVLRMEDERKYATILPTEFDSGPVAQEKMTNVIRTLEQDLANFNAQQQLGGRRTSTGRGGGPGTSRPAALPPSSRFKVEFEP